MLCHNAYSDTASAVEREHAAELSVGCSGESLRRKLDGLTGQDDFRVPDDQDCILSKLLGVLERRVHWLLLRAQVVGNIV